jgi:hypothetical protein
MGKGPVMYSGSAGSKYSLPDAAVWFALAGLTSPLKAKIEIHSIDVVTRAVFLQKRSAGKDKKDRAK